MKMSGSIRRTNPNTGRSVANWKASPLLALPWETARPGLGAQYSGPGAFFIAGPILFERKVFCTVPKSVLLPHIHTSYFIPLERKSRLRTARSNFDEQGSAL